MLLQTQTRAKPETLQTARAVLETIAGSDTPMSAVDICREFNMPKGRHAEVSHVLKLLRKHGNIKRISGGKRTSKYAITENSPDINGAVKGVISSASLTALPLTKGEREEQTAVAPVPKVPKARLLPTSMVEIPKASLKVLVKAVMANCSPMEGVLQRAVLQCMEKLI